MALTTLAAWLMACGFIISTIHELYRATAKARVSRYDSIREVLTRTLPFYVAALAVVLALGSGMGWVEWPALGLAIGMVLVSALYYNPTVMAARQPGMIDWAEDIAFTGLFFASGVLLVAHVTGNTLTV